MDIKKTKIVNVGEYGSDVGTSGDYTIIVNNLLQGLKGGEGDTIVSFPQGTYHFYPDHAPKREFHTSNTDTRNHPIKRVCFLIEELENITIEGNDSLFIFHGDVMGFGIFHSKNIQLQNLSWDYEVPTLSELEVLGTGKDQDTIYADYKIGNGIPYEISDDQQSFYWLSEKSPYSKELYWKDEGSKNDMVIVGYDEVSGVKRRHEVNNGPFANNKIRLEEREKGIVRIYYDQALPAEVVPNRVFEFCKVTDRNTAGALIWESENICLTNVTIHYLHGFGFLVQMSGDVSFRECQFVPNTAKGKHGSSFADSIHVSGAKGKILIDGCTFRHPHDDPINIHGTFTRVQKKINENTLEVIYAHQQQSGFPQYHIGDKIVFFNRATMGEDFPNEYEVIKVVHPGQDGNNLQTMQVTLNRSVPFDMIENEHGEYIYVMENVTYTPEVVITNNSFAQVPTRGILCTTRRKVLIEGNHFENITMSPIFISNDSNDWYESGPVRDMTIRGNTFYVTHIESWHYRKPAIYIHPIPLGEKVSPVPIHKNITIEDNVFYMNHEYVVSARNVDNLVIKNNKIINIDQDRGGNEMLAVEYHQKYNSEHAVLFEFDTCENVLIEGNTYNDFIAYALISQMKKSDLIIKNEQTAIMET